MMAAVFEELSKSIKLESWSDLASKEVKVECND